MQAIVKLFRKDPHVSVLSIITVTVLVVLVALLQNQFLSVNNLQSMAYQVPEFGFIAMAMALTMLTGGIDLSLIANAGLSGVIAAYILSGAVFPLANGGLAGPAIILAVLVALSIATLCGLFNGLLIARLSVPPILATLGTMILYTGIGMAITSGKGVVGFPEAFLKFGSGSVGSIPYVFILFILAALLISVVLSRTTFGKRIYLLGENHTALRFSGTDTERLLIKVYAMAGLLAGFAALIIISRVNSAKVGYGDTYLLQAILVAVLGGVNPDGGQGRIAGVMLGMAILQMLQSAFTLFTFSPYSKKLIWGFMLLLVMIINRIIDRARTNKPKQIGKASVEGVPRTY